MVDVPLRGVGSVSDRGGSGGRPYGGKQERRAGVPGRLQVAPTDEVRLHKGRGVALQLLRERVLATTRQLLDLGPAHGGRAPVDEPMPTVGEFLSRLLCEQNQLANQRTPGWDGARVRRAIVEAMQAGAAEALDLLESSGRFEAESVQVIVEVLAEFGSRIRALAERTDDGR